MIKQGVFLTDSHGSYVRRYQRKRIRRWYAAGRMTKGVTLPAFMLAVLAVSLYLILGYCVDSVRSGTLEADAELKAAVPEAVMEPGTALQEAIVELKTMVSEIVTEPEKAMPEMSVEEETVVRMPELRQIPVQAGGMVTGFELLGGNYTYYAGPSDSLRKEPGEILIALDPGHGGLDDGCVKGGVVEKELNLSIAAGVKERLEAMGYQVMLTRDSDCALSLKERVRMAEAVHADLYVSIHQNSSELSRVNGMELYYSAQNAAEDSRRLSEQIQTCAVRDTGANARAIFEWEELYVIRESRMPSCLIETGYLTNAKERGRLKTTGYQASLADGIAKGIDQYFWP